LPKQITLDELSTITLARHFLVSGPQPEEITEAVGRLCGLNAQSARAPYVSLWNRVEGFTKETLTEALYEEKTLIKAWLMRGTVHIIPTADFPVYQKALGGDLCKAWEASLKKQTLLDLPRTWTRLLDAIANSLGEGPLVKKDLVERVKSLIGGYTESEQKRLVGWALRLLTYQGRVCHDRPTGPWYHFKDNRFALVSDWLAPERIGGTVEEEARHDLLIKYLGGYGPATIHDFAYWAGLKIPKAKQVFRAARKHLSEISVEGSKATFWVLAEDLDSLVGREPGKRVCFLPEFDSLIMGHKDKSRLIDAENRTKVFLGLARVVPTLLLDGRLAGTWDYRFGDQSLHIKPFGRLSQETSNTIKAASRHLKEFLKEETAPQPHP